MNYIEYKEIVKETVLNEYPTYYQDKILRMLKEEKLVFNDKRSVNKLNLLDITSYNKTYDKMRCVIDKLDKAVKKIEWFEFNRAYRYSVIFKINNYSDNMLDELFEKKWIKIFSEDISERDVVKTSAYAPTCLIEEIKTKFKFSFELANKSEPYKSIKYTVLAIIHKDINILEIRLDTASYNYRDSEVFYKEKIKSVKSWFYGAFKDEITIENIDLEPVVKYMKLEKFDEVTIVALKMRRDGMVAYLDSASNEELMIPILGELKDLLNKEEDKFNKNKYTKEIKIMLDNFILKVEEMSELPQVSILWDKKKVKVTLTHEYNKEKYSLFRYSDELGEEEMMDYVTKYIIDCKRELDEKCDN